MPKFNNPQIGAGFSNISKAFSPTAGDLASIHRERLNSAKAVGQIMKNEASGNLRSNISNIFNQSVVDPSGAAVSPDSRLQNNLGDLISNLIVGGNASNLGGTLNAITANLGGTTDGAVSRAFVGSGKSIGPNDAFSLAGQDLIRGGNQQNDIAKEQAKPRTINPGQGLANIFQEFIAPDAAEARSAKASSTPTGEVGMKEVEALDSLITGMLPDDVAIDVDMKNELLNLSAEAMRGGLDPLQSVNVALDSLLGAGRENLVKTKGGGATLNPLTGFGLWDGRDGPAKLTTKESKAENSASGQQPITATNPTTGEVVQSNDGGKTWSRIQ